MREETVTVFREEKKELKLKESEQKKLKQKKLEQKESKQKKLEQNEPEQKKPEQKKPKQKKLEQKKLEQKELKQKRLEQKKLEQKESKQKEPEQKKSGHMESEKRKTGQGEKEMSSKQKLKNLVRSYHLCHELAPYYVMRQSLGGILHVISRYVDVYLSGLVVSMITGDRSFADVFRAVLLCVAVKFLLRILRTLATVPKQTLSSEGFRVNAKMLMAKKTSELDYEQVEKPEIHRAKELAENFLFGGANRWNGMGRLLGETNDIVEDVAVIIFGVGMCFSALFLTNGSDKASDFARIIQSRWAALFLVLGYAVVLYAGTAAKAKEGKKMSAFHASPEFAQISRVLNFYLDFHRNRYQRGKEIRLYQQSGLLLHEWDTYRDKEKEYQENMVKNTNLVVIAAQLLKFLADVLTYTFIITRAATGMYTAAQAVTLVLSITYMLEAVSMILYNRVVFFDIIPQNMQYVFDYLDIPKERYAGSIPTEKRDDNEYEFEFSHVSFRYPGTEQDVLKDINLKWRIGEKMALVGRNGSGKSTLVKLLCRLYEPTGGKITLNGIDIRKYSEEEYMALFSVVFQDAKLFSFSIAENVAANTEYDEARVEDCVKRAGLSRRLSEMPQGMETCLYKDFDEKGVEISGGEVQKLCLARAVYKGAPFIILDEPTAALDPVSEYEIYTKFNEIVGTRTAIYISHRLSSCRFCDDITVLEDGRIVERGTHEQLVSVQGVYAGLWSAQAEYYTDTAKKGANC